MKPPSESWFRVGDQAGCFEGECMTLAGLVVGRGRVGVGGGTGEDIPELSQTMEGQGKIISGDRR